MRIVHIADVHIRGSQRHEEYKRIFTDFCQKTSNQNVDCIFIAGDIFHTKTSGITPEYLDFMKWWLNEIASVAPVHIILGNHDGSLINSTRQDAITPIVSLLDDDRIRLHKKSGTYDMCGAKLHVYSIFDRENWSSIVPVRGAINIATYHGPVVGAETEVGWLVDEADVNTEMFAAYDFAMLGDIHRLQHLDTRRDKDDVPKPWISYPGSCVQQNYGESLDHGYLLWDIKSRSEWDVKFHKLVNPMPFMTVEWMGTVPVTIDEIRKLPEGARCRIRSSVDLSQHDMLVLTRVAKEQCVSEVMFKVDASTRSDVISSIDDSDLKRSDLRSVDVLMKLVKRTTIQQLSDDEWSRVDDVVSKTLRAIPVNEDVARNVRWSLEELRFDNLFCYGSGNKIDFAQLRGIVGIFGPNRLGKSSIPGTLMYALFNTTDRGVIKNIDVCNIRKEQCSARAIINVGATKYVIERSTTKHNTKKNVQYAFNSLDVFRVVDGELIEMNGDGRTDSDKTIRSIIGTSDDFLVTALSSQGNIDQFIKSGQSLRRKMLNKFLDLDVFEQLYDVVKEEVKNIKAGLRHLGQHDWDAEAVGTSVLIEQCNAELQDHASRLCQLKVDLASVKSDMATLGHPTLVTDSQLQHARKRVDDLEGIVTQCVQQKDALQEKILEKTSKISRVSAVIDEHDINKMREELSDLSTGVHELAQAKSERKLEESRVATCHKSLKLLSEVPCNDAFPTCKFIRDAHANKVSLVEHEAALSMLNDKLKVLEKKVDVVRTSDLKSKIHKLEKLKELKSDLISEVASLEVQASQCQHTYEKNLTLLEEARVTLNNLEHAYNNSVNVEAVTLRSKAHKIEAALSAVESMQLKCATKLGRLETDQANFIKKRDEHVRLMSELKLHEVAQAAFSKRGIPRDIISTQLPAVNTEIMSILAGFVDFTIEFAVDDDSDKLDIYINYGDSRRIIELASGMEKMVASLAIRTALCNMTTLPRSDILFVDEGFGALDPVQMEQVGRLLTSLAKHFRAVVVISHFDAIKDVAETTIEVTRNEHDSKVVYVL